jgi:RNA-directed DNA polymerase
VHLEYVRWADDLIILIDCYRKWRWLERTINIRLRQELSKLKVELNEEKTQADDLTHWETFSFLGFDFRQTKTLKGKIGIRKTPRMSARTRLLRKLKEVFRRYVSQKVSKVISLINPVVRGWANYFRIGNSSRCFGYVKDWIEKHLRRHLMRARKRNGFVWKRWSRSTLYEEMGLYNDYQIRHYRPL